MQLSGWIAIVLTIATPVLAFAGAIVGAWWTRRSAIELDTWRRREETMRLLRWAVQAAASEDRAEARAGLATLAALRSSELLQPEDLNLVSAVIDAMLEDAAAAYAALLERTDPDDVEIVEEE